MFAVLRSWRGLLQRLRPPGRATGWIALGATIVIWAGYLVVARWAVDGRFSPVEVGLLRFGPAALLFLPFAISRRAELVSVHPATALGLGLFGGAGFILLLGAGLQFAPVADAAIFTPAMLPAFVAFLGFVALGEAPGARARIGIAIILLGAGATGIGAALAGLADGTWKGHLLFLGASASWAIYTLVFRASGLSAVTGSFLLCAIGTLLLLGFARLTGQPMRLPPLAALGPQVLLHGVLAGFASTFTFFVAVRRLGSAIPSAAAALVPGIAALMAWGWLAEVPEPLRIAGLAVVSVGVLVTSAPRRQRLGHEGRQG